MNASTLNIVIEVDDKGSVKIRQLGDTVADAGKKGEDGGKRMGRSLGEIDGIAGKAVTALKGVAMAGAAIGGAAGLGGIYLLTGALRESVQLASDMEEAQSKFNTVFGELSAQAEQWAGELRKSYHMSSLDAKKYLAAMQDLLVPMGMNSEAAAAMSFEVVKLSADLGSFNNLPTAQVMDDIQSALVGNYETMKKYGVVVNAATVEEKALAMGLAETKDAITAADKAQAAYQLIVEGSTFAVGDAIRTAKSFANQMRDLEVNITELKIAAGEALLPVINNLVTGLNEWLTANEDLLKQNIQEFVSKLIPIIEGTAKAIGWLVEQIDNWIEGAKILGIIEDENATRREEAAKKNATIKALEEEIALHESILAVEGLRDDARVKHQELLDRATEKYRALTYNIDANKVSIDELSAGLDAYYGAGISAGEATDAQGESHGKTAKEIEKHATELQKLLDKYLPLKKEAEDVTAAEDGLNELRASGTITLEEYQLALDNLRKSTAQYKEDEKKLAEAIKATEERVKEKQKAEEEAVKAAAELSKAYMDIYGEMADSSAAMSQRSYEAQVKALDEQLAAYRKMGVDENLLNELRYKRQRELDKKKLRSSGEFFGGVIAAAMDAEDAMQSMADIGYQAFNMLSDTFSQTFVAVMEGEFDSIGDIWDSLLDNMLNMFIQFIADLLAKWAMTEIVSLFGSFGGSGSGWGSVLGSIGSLISGSPSSNGGGGVGSGASTAGSAVSTATTGYALYSYLSGGGAGNLANAGWVGDLVAQYQVSEIAAEYAAAEAAAIAAEGAATYAELEALSAGLEAYYGYEAGSVAAAEGSGVAISSYVPVIGTVVAAAMALYFGQEKKMLPDEADMFNRAGFRPETFASLIGNEFTRTMVPYFGEYDAKWDQASSTLIMLADAEKTKNFREDYYFSPDVDSAAMSTRSIRWDAMAPTWDLDTDVLAAVNTLFGSASDMGQGLIQMSLGIDGVPETLDEFAVALDKMNISLDPSTIEEMWKWAEKSKPSFDKIKTSLEDMGLKGGYMQQAMSLLESAATSATGSTEDLENYLISLGHTQEEVADMLADYTGSAISKMRDAGEAYLAATNPVLHAMSLMAKEMTDVTTDTSGLSNAVGVFGDEANTVQNAVSALNAEIFDLDVAASRAGATIGEAAYDISAALAELTGTGTGATPTAGGPPVTVGNWDGGIIGYADGGILQGGSGVRDDLYLGTVNGKAQLAVGGEYIMPQAQTIKYLTELEAMRADRYLLGGPTKGVPPVSPRPINPSPLDTTRSGDDPAAIAKYMNDILFKIAQMGRSGLERDLASLHRSMAETVARAKELGASEKDLADIRKLEALQTFEILEAHKKARQDFMRGITDEIDSYSMTDQQLAIRETVRTMEKQLAAARELGVGEEGLANIRKLQGLKAAEIMIEGLRTAITSMQSFRESMAATEAGVDRSAEAQQKLFATLAQAKKGDFSGVEAIGEVLQNIAINKESYATAADYARDYWRTMSAVSELERLTTVQVQPQGFADGGEFGGGWRLVGEQGPELEYTGPSRIYSNDQSRALVDLSEVVAEIRELRQEIAATGYQGLKNSGKAVRVLERWDAIGLPPERAAA